MQKVSDFQSRCGGFERVCNSMNLAYNFCLCIQAGLSLGHLEYSKQTRKNFKITKPLLISFRTDIVLSARLFDLSSNQNQKPFEKKFATLAARAVFVSSFLLQKQLIYDFLAGNNYTNQPHLQEGVKFAIQISPLLNY